MQNLGSSSYDSSFESRSSGEIEKEVLAELNAFLKQERKADGLTPEIRTEAAHVKDAVTTQTGGNLILEKGEAKEPQPAAEARRWAPIKLRGGGEEAKITMGRRAQGESPKLDNARLVPQNNPDESLIFQMDNEDDTLLLSENKEEVLELPEEFGNFGLGEDFANELPETPKAVVVESRPKVESKRDLETSALKEPSKPGSLQKAAQKVSTGFKSLFSRKQVKEKESPAISKGNPVDLTSSQQITDDKKQALRSRTEVVIRQNSNAILEQLPQEIKGQKGDERSTALEGHVRATIENGGLKDFLINLGFTKKESQEITELQNKTTQSRGKEISIREFMTREICYCMMPIIQGSNQ